jgi:hypothetical protein
MPSFFEKLKKMLGFYPRPYYYKMEPATEEPIKVEYTPEPAPAAPAPESQPQAEEPAVDTKADGIDLAAMTKIELRAFAAERSISVNTRMSKQQLIDAINEAL